MLLKLLQIGIVGFWLATTGWLVQTIWFSGRLSSGPLATRQTLDRFFEWNDTNDLAILENGERIGLMTINGSSGIDRETGRFTREFSTAGSIRSAGVTELKGMMGSSWRVTAEFDKDYELTRGLLSFRMPSEAMRFNLEIDGEPAILTATVERQEMEIFRTSRPLGGVSEESAIPELPAGALPMGLSPGILKLWKPEFETGRATLSVAGRDLPVYQLNVKIGGEHSISAYLSEDGGPLRIQTSWGQEAVAEAIMPVGE